MIYFCYVLVVVQFMLLCLSAKYLYKFVKTIMAFEDNHSDAIEDYYEVIDVLIATEQQLQEVVNMPIFFENQELRKIIDDAKQTTIVSRMNVRRCAENFIKRSKEKNISYEEVIEPEEIYNKIEESASQYDLASAQIEQTLNKKGVNTVFGRTS